MWGGFKDGGEKPESGEKGGVTNSQGSTPSREKGKIRQSEWRKTRRLEDEKPSKIRAGRQGNCVGTGGKYRLQRIAAERRNLRKLYLIKKKR